MKKIILYSSIFLVQAIAFGQTGKLKRADNYYNLLAYSVAATDYEGLLGSAVDGPALQSKLANCYAKLGRTDKAEAMYAKMISSPVATPYDMFQYSQVLKQNGKTTESDSWMKRFQASRNTDLRAVEFNNNRNYLELIQEQGGHFDIKNLAVNTSATEFGAYPSTDGKSIYFITSRHDSPAIKRVWLWNNEGFLDVYKGTASGTQEIENPEMVSKKVNTSFHEGPLCFSPTGSRVYFTRNNLSKGAERKDKNGIQNLKLYMAEVLPDGTWVNEKESSLNSTEFSVGHPTISADGEYLYFASDMPGGFGGADIYRSLIKADGILGTPENLGPKINTEGQEMFPWATPQGQLFLSSDGHLGLGGLDVFVAVVDKKGSFTKLLNAGKPLNSNQDDFAFTMNADGKQGYFSSNRPGGKGEDDIYSFTLLKPFKSTIALTGFVVHADNTPVAGAMVQLVDEEGKIIDSVQSNEAGMYTFELNEGLNYQLMYQKKDYFNSTESVSTLDLPSGTDNITKDVRLDKDPGLALDVLVRNSATEAPLEGVKIEVIDTYSKINFLEGVTPATGELMKGISGKKMGDQLSYIITLSKEGYLSKTVTFNSKVAKSGMIKVHELMDLTMDKIEVGGDLATMIDIKPIYFDLGKSIIRKDAATELDKIVEVMNKYPTMEIELGSHTDCRGKKAANDKLSGARAAASAAYVRAKITNPDRIQGRGYGETKLKNDCGCEGPVKSTCSEAEHQVNRRTEFIILKM